jgi:predicted phosphodiesterase
MYTYTALMTDLDDVVDPPDQRDQVESHQGARVIVFGHLHLGQAETLRCTLKRNRIHKQ